MRLHLRRLWRRTVSKHRLLRALLAAAMLSSPGGGALELLGDIGRTGVARAPLALTRGLAAAWHRIGPVAKPVAVAVSAAGAGVAFMAEDAEAQSAVSVVSA